MGEHRKPTYILLLKNQSKRKTTKVELFPRELFTNEPMPKRHFKAKYRIRVNGRWFPNKEVKYFASWEIKELFWRGMPF